MKVKTALILCAGFGKRVQPITDSLPKPLINYKDEPLLENTIKFLIKLSLLTPGFIGSKKDTVILPGFLIIPCFGQTLPEFKAMGTQEIFKASYILTTPFLKGTLSSTFTLVP